MEFATRPADLPLEQAKFGWMVPPPRVQIDGNAGAFQPMGDTVNPNPVLVLGLDGNLWLEHAPFGKVPPQREQVDGNVAAFQAMDLNNIYVLGTDGNLWLEHAPFGAVPPKREKVDGNVAAFQAIDVDSVYVLGTDGNLWLEYTESGIPWGQVPPPRRQIDGHVAAFFALDYANAYVLGTDGNLWLEHAGSGSLVGPGWGQVPPPREHVDGHVAAFQPIDANTIYVLGLDGNLWLEHSVNGRFGQVPPPREQVDGSVDDFQAIDTDNIYVLGNDGNLWLEHSVNGRFGEVPPPREQVDGNVKAPTAFGITVRPSYQILALIYAPPGTNGGKSMSSVDYGAGSSTGTTTSTSNSFKHGMDISASVSAGPITANADFSFSKTTSDASSIDCKKTESRDIKITGPAADGINHDHDCFVLWLNPMLSVAIDRRNRASWGLGIDGQNMMIQYVYVGWLKNPASMPPGIKQQLDAAGLKPSDYASILSTDPFANGNNAIDPNRYWPVTQSFPYEPPLTASDPVAVTTYTVQNSVTTTNTHSEEIQYGVSISVKAEAKFPVFSASVSVAQNFQWTNSNSQSLQNQSTQSASVSIGGPSFGYTGPTDLLVYWDSIYSSFMFAFPTQPPSASGLVVDPNGRPVPNEPVTLTIGSVKMMGFTDSKGEYRFYHAPAGEGTLSARAKQFAVTVGSGTPAQTVRLLD